VILNVGGILDPCRATAVFLTDLDGTLLDPDSYSTSHEAIEVIEQLADQGIVTIPVTSKTASEVEAISSDLGLPSTAVVEGGAVLLESDGSTRVFGRSARELRDILRALKEEGWELRGLSEMTVAEVRRLTGLDEESARRALQRLGSEPFLVQLQSEEELSFLTRRITEHGARMVRGGRFFHLLDRSIGKRFALGWLHDLFPNLVGTPSGAVGDAWNDLGMLSVVDRGFLLGSAVHDDHIPEGVIRVAEVGPEGFVFAAERFIEYCRIVRRLRVMD
jgi:mannosyl-3-phosphoglycerate phosphatase